jgi:hypothetical protein
MSDIKILTKNDCISTIKSEDHSVIHPLINNISHFNIISDSNKKNITRCLIIPQILNEINKNTLFFSLEKNKLNKRKKKDKLIFDTNNKDIEDSKISESISELSLCDDECNNPLINFTLPINSNNFLDVVLSMTTVEQLYEWLDNCIDDDKKMIGIVLDLFWKNYYNIIDENIELFIKINHKIIDLIFNRKLSNDIVSSISVTIIKKYSGKKINYLNKIKKYLMKYI